MIKFNKTGISSTPTKSGRSIVYTDILSGITYSGITTDQSFNGTSFGEMCYIRISGDTYTGINSGSTFNIIISGITYTGITSGNTFNIMIKGGTFYSGFTDIVYHWVMYVPKLSGQTLSEYLNKNASIYEQDIIRKEALWLISPHTEEIFDPITRQTKTVNIPKERIVCPTIPDYEEIVSDPTFDIKSIKRLLINLTNTLSQQSVTTQQIKDLAVIHDNYMVGKEYNSGDFFCFNGDLYQVIQSHISKAEYLPSETISLYTLCKNNESSFVIYNYIKKQSEIEPILILTGSTMFELNCNIVTGSTGYNYDTITLPYYVKERDIIISILRTKYDLNDEFALINNYNSGLKIDEYNDYQSYRLYVKNITSQVMLLLTNIIIY